MTSFLASGGSSIGTIDWSAVDFSAITTNITAAIPTILPVVVAVLGLRKGISFVMGSIRGC